MSDPLAEPEDATPLTPDERDGLRQSWITHRRDLNEAEARRARLEMEIEGGERRIREEEARAEADAKAPRAARPAAVAGPAC